MGMTPLIRFMLPISVVCVCLFWSTPAKGQLTGFVLGHTTGQQLSNAYAGLRQAQGSSARVTADIEEARARYFAEWPDGAALESARAAYLDALTRKDLYYVLQAWATRFTPEAANLLTLLGVTIDGGIHTRAKPAFDEWLRVLLEGSERTSILSTPDFHVDAAMAAYDEYRRIRDQLEHFAGTKSGLYSAEAYDRMAGLLTLTRDGTPEEGVAFHRALVEVFSAGLADSVVAAMLAETEEDPIYTAQRLYGAAMTWVYYTTTPRVPGIGDEPQPPTFRERIATLYQGLAEDDAAPGAGRLRAAKDIYDRIVAREGLEGLATFMQSVVGVEGTYDCAREKCYSRYATDPEGVAAEIGEISAAIAQAAAERSAERSARLDAVEEGSVAWHEERLRQMGRFSHATLVETILRPLNPGPMTDEFRARSAVIAHLSSAARHIVDGWGDASEVPMSSWYIAEAMGNLDARCESAGSESLDCKMLDAAREVMAPVPLFEWDGADAGSLAGAIRNSKNVLASRTTTASQKRLAAPYLKLGMELMKAGCEAGRFPDFQCQKIEPEQQLRALYEPWIQSGADAGNAPLPSPAGDRLDAVILRQEIAPLPVDCL